MKRFINTNNTNYHHETIKDFSDNSKFLTSGLAKGYSSKEYSWIADFIFKSTGNLSLNKHICYISFFGEADIMYQEYANVSEIYDVYPFFSHVERLILSDLTFELSSKQYYKIGQTHSEYDLIQYTNMSKLERFEPGPIDDIKSQHEYYRAPVFVQSGSKLDLDVDDEMVFYDRYLFSNKEFITSYIGEYASKITSPLAELPGYGYFGQNQTYYDNYNGVVSEFIDYKINIDNSKYEYFEDGEIDLVMYPNDSEHYKSRLFNPYYGLVRLYQTNNADDVYDWRSPSFIFSDNIYMFPELIVNGKLEPSKVIIEMSPSDKDVAMSFYNGNSLNDPRDQSRIVYNSCGSMLRKMESGDSTYYKIEKEVGGKTVYSGIDLDTERNRRYSAVVMTEPYFVTVPISKKLVEYSFVFGDGTPVKNWNYEPIFLKIKSSLDVFTELEKELSKSDYNEDVINTLSIDNVVSNHNYLLGGTSSPGPLEADYYNVFGGDADAFHERQNDCVDDLVGGIVGSYDDMDPTIGTHRKFYIDYGMDYLGGDETKYSNSEMKICGVGIEYKKDNPVLKIYCTNYVAVDAPKPDDSSEEPRFGPGLEFVDKTMIDSYEKNELFRPMIKMSGMNGYVKIMRRDNNFKTSRASDGKHERVYQVEFPYCPGSYDVRKNMDFVFDEDDNPEPLNMGFILRKESYINAGSQEVSDGSDKYDMRNDRFVPYGDDSFSELSVLSGFIQEIGTDNLIDGKIKTDHISKGGKFRGSISSEKSLIKYPRDLVLKTVPEHRLPLRSLVKPRYNKFRRYGTFEIGIKDPNREDETYPVDVKTFSLVDNRKWKFDNDKFSSYIGRENPSYVFEIDISTLSKNFNEFQRDHGAIPDSKRWLYSFFSGFANILPSKDITSNTSEGDVSDGDDSEALTTDSPNYDLPHDDVKSDVIMEIWDQESDIGNDKKGTWRPFIAIGADEDKVPGKLIVDNVYVMNVASEMVDDPVEVVAGKMWKIFIGHVVNDGNIISQESDPFHFPDYINYTDGEKNILNNESNLILYNKITKQSYHIAYMKKPTVNPLNDEAFGRQLYEVYVRSDDGNFDTLDVNDIPSEGVLNPYQIYRPLKTLSGDTRFSMNSIRAKNGVDLGFLTRFIDLKSREVDSPDFDRYVLNNKIFFRLRVSRARQFPVSYVDEDNSEMPYVGPDIETKGIPGDVDGVNFPWSDPDGENPDEGFDWKKIETLETVRKFGLNYFKCASK